MSIGQVPGSDLGLPSVGSIGTPLVNVTQKEAEMIGKLRALKSSCIALENLGKITDACDGAHDTHLGFRYHNIGSVQEWSDTLWLDFIADKNAFKPELVEKFGRRGFRPYIAFFEKGKRDTDPVKFTLIKLGPTGDQDQVFDEKAGTFVPLDDDIPLLIQESVWRLRESSRDSTIKNVPIF
jgi:hypothetical protein